VAPEARSALYQLAGVVSIAGIVVVGGALSKERPADAAQLRIPVGELRSQAAELAQLEGDTADGHLSASIARRHVIQLDKAFESTLHDLTSLDVLPPLATSRRDALALAHELERRLAGFGAHAAPDARAPPTLRDGLQQIEDTLRRAA